MADGQEEFSFPASATDFPPCFMESPPLWGWSPTAIGFTKQEEDEGNYFNLCPAHEFKASISNDNHRKEDDQEKMDILWECLNEEFSTTCGEVAVEKHSEHSSPGTQVQISCIKAFKFSKHNMLPVPSILVFIKVLKKIFAMQQQQQQQQQQQHSNKKRAW